MLLTLQPLSCLFQSDHRFDWMNQIMTFLVNVHMNHMWWVLIVLLVNCKQMWNCMIC